MLVFHTHSKNTGADGEKIIFYFQEILIGNTAQCHIRVAGLPRDLVAIKIHHQQEGILAEGVDNFPFFLNNKKFIGTKVIKVNDTLSIDDFSLTLKEANFSLSKSPINLEETYDFFYANHQEYETVMSALERELILSDD